MISAGRLITIGFCFFSISIAQYGCTTSSTTNQSKKQTPQKTQSNQPSASNNPTSSQNSPKNRASNQKPTDKSNRTNQKKSTKETTRKDTNPPSKSRTKDASGSPKESNDPNKPEMGDNIPPKSVPRSDEKAQSMEPGAMESDPEWETSNQLPTTSTSTTNQDDISGTGPISNSSSNRPLENELNAALENFDGEILSQRAVLIEMTNEAKQQNTSAYDKTGKTSSESSADARKQSATSSSANQPGNRMPTNSTTANRGYSSTGSNLPPDIPDARDDDIIARQLRDAAMKEKDPALKEKLWEEYQKYKRK